MRAFSATRHALALIASIDRVLSANQSRPCTIVISSTYSSTSSSLRLENFSRCSAVPESAVTPVEPHSSDASPTLLTPRTSPLKPSSQVLEALELLDLPPLPSSGGAGTPICTATAAAVSMQSPTACPARLTTGTGSRSISSPVARSQDASHCSRSAEDRLTSAPNKTTAQKSRIKSMITPTFSRSMASTTGRKRSLGYMSDDDAGEA